MAKIISETQASTWTFTIHLNIDTHVIVDKCRTFILQKTDVIITPNRKQGQVNLTIIINDKYLIFTPTFKTVSLCSCYFSCKIKFHDFAT